MNKSTMKPFCKVCYDTGKSESQYTSHFVKDIPGHNGIVVCSTLLSLECRYCKKIGHTVSRCPLVHEKRKKPSVLQKKEKKTAPAAVSNIFHALYMDCEKSEEEHAENEAPAILTRNPNSYASVLIREVVPRSPSTSPPPLFEPHTPEGPPPNIYAPISQSTSLPSFYRIPQNMNWADISDSDDDF